MNIKFHSTILIVFMLMFSLSSMETVAYTEFSEYSSLMPSSDFSITEDPEKTSQNGYEFIAKTIKKGRAVERDLEDGAPIQTVLNRYKDDFLVRDARGRSMVSLNYYIPTGVGRCIRINGDTWDKVSGPEAIQLFDVSRMVRIDESDYPLYVNIKIGLADILLDFSENMVGLKEKSERIKEILKEKPSEAEMARQAFSEFSRHLHAETRKCKESINELTGSTDIFDSKIDEMSLILKDLRHDVFGNDLTTVFGYAELAKHSVRSSDYPRAVNALNVFDSAIDKLIADLKTFENILRRKQDKTLVDIEKTCAELFNQYRHLAEAKGLKMEFASQGGPFLMEGDPALLRIAINQLLENALKYTKRGSVKLALTQDGIDSEIVIKVKDTGQGIPPEELPKIFKTGFRTQEAREGNVNGLGWGLSSVKRIIGMHDAKIDVESEVDVGTEFTVKLVPVDLKSIEFISKKGLAGRDAAHVDIINPRLEEWLRHNEDGVKVIDYYFENGKWAPYKVDYLEGYVIGMNDKGSKLTDPKFQLSDQEQQRLNDTLSNNSYMNLGRNVRLRVILGELSAAWKGDIDHSSLVHLGERTATVWFGEGLLRDLLKNDVDALRDKIFKHEKEHLLGNHDIDNEPGYDDLVREVYEDRVLKLIPEDMYRKSVQRSADWLIDSYNPKTGLCDSYDDEGGLNVPDSIAPAAHIFDQALWIMAMDSMGAHENAENVLKALSEIQNPDGSFYSAYNANDRNVIFDDVRLGPVAFVIMANNFHVFATGGVANGDKKYLNMAKKAADYLLAQQGNDGSFRTSTNTGGFASVEENIDCYSSLYYLARITGDPKYTDAVNKVKQFLQKTWDNDKGYFYKSMEYLFFFGTPNPGIAYDTSVWGYLLLGDKGEQGELYARGLDFIKNKLLVSEDTGFVHLDENKQFQGAFWVDPTIWYAIARLKRGDMGEALHYYNNMLKHQTVKGGYPLNHWLNRGKHNDSHPNPVWPLYPFEGIHPAAASVFFYNTLKKPDFNIFHPNINVGTPLSGMTIKNVPITEEPPVAPVNFEPASEDPVTSAA